MTSINSGIYNSGAGDTELSGVIKRPSYISTPHGRECSLRERLCRLRRDKRKTESQKAQYAEGDKTMGLRKARLVINYSLDHVWHICV